MVRGSNPAKLREWTKRLQRFEKSQATVSQFCEREGISPPSFYHWKKKLREPPGKPLGAQKRFQAVHLAASVQARPESTVHLGRGIQIELGSDLRIAESIVQQLLKSVETNSAGTESC